MNKDHFDEHYFIEVNEDGDTRCRQDSTSETEQLLVQALNDVEEKELEYLLLETTHTLPTKLLTISLLSMYYNRGYLVENDEVSRLLFENKEFYRWLLRVDPELEIMRKWKSRFLVRFRDRKEKRKPANVVNSRREKESGEMSEDGSYSYFLVE